jgi:hypothetical protein
MLATDNSGNHVTEKSINTFETVGTNILCLWYEISIYICFYLFISYYYHLITKVTIVYQQVSKDCLYLLISDLYIGFLKLVLGYHKSLFI